MLASPMSHPLARPLVRERRPSGHSDVRAFTLIELLAVIAIIGILSAITFGIIKGVNDRAAVSQAKSELSVLAQALEGYKRQYGDYPQIGSAANVANAASASTTDAPGILFNALTGKRGPVAATAIDGKSFVDVSKFNLQDSTTAAAQPQTGAVQAANAFVDPWGRRYLYYYKVSASWTAPSYILLSVGALIDTSGSSGITVNANGTYTVSDTINGVDNIYANQ